MRAVSVANKQVLPKTRIADVHVHVYYKSQNTFIPAFSWRCETWTWIASKKPIRFYVWGEYHYGKVANEIGSSLYHYSSTQLPREQLKCAHPQTPVLLKTQIHVCYTFYAWATTTVHRLSNVKHCPVQRHSFFPSDRALGRMEKSLRRIESILLPSEYCGIFS